LLSPGSLSEKTDRQAGPATSAGIRKEDAADDWFGLVSMFLNYSALESGKAHTAFTAKK